MADNWQLKAVLSAVDNMSPALKKVATQAKTTRKYLADVGSSAADVAGRIGMPLALVSGAFSVGSLAGLKVAISNFTALGDEVHKTAQRMGVSTDEFQRLQYMANQSGVSTEGLQAATGKLNKEIAKAANGKNKDLAALFAKTGVSMRDANGHLRSATDLLPEIAEMFAKNKNAAIQAQMGTALYGKGWQELMPLLAGGRDGIDELIERHKMLGTTVNEEAILAGEKLGDQLDDLHLVTQSYGNTLATKLVPALSPLVEKMIAWAVANREVITTKLAKFAEDVANELAKIDWNAVIDGVRGFIDGARDLIGWLGGAKNALIALVVVMNIQTIMAIGGLIANIGKLGMSLYAFSGGAVPATIAAMGAMNMSMGAANAGGLALIKTLGLLAVAAAAGYAVGSLINSGINAATEKLSGGKYKSLGEAAAGDYGPSELDYDEINRQRAARGAAPIAAPGGSKSSAQIDLNINGAPPGTKVEQIKAKGGAEVNVSATGQRGFAKDGK